MSRMGTLLDGRNPSEIGTPIDSDNDMTRYETLVDAIQASTAAETIAWFARAGSGRLMRIDAKDVTRWNLPAGTAAVVEWTDGNENDAESWVQALDAEQVELLRAENECVAVDAIVEHYRRKPADDGHPAHALYRLNERWREQRS